MAARTATQRRERVSRSPSRLQVILLWLAAPPLRALLWLTAPLRRALRRALAPFVRAAAAVRRLLAAAVAGDRPFRAAVVAVIVLSGLAMAGPLGTYLEGRDRVAVLELQRAALAAEIDRLESRAADLHDDAQIELIAREQLGLVRPGEVPYIVVVPEPDRPQVVPPTEIVPPDRPWYRRLIDRVTGLVR